MKVCIGMNSLLQVPIPTCNCFVRISDDQDAFATIAENIFKPERNLLVFSYNDHKE